MPEAVHLWTLETSSFDYEAYWRRLSPEEQARAGRFTHDGVKRNHVATHGLLHEMLSEIYGITQFRLAIAEHGKPCLVASSADIRINLAHTGGMVAASATIGAEVGVDVEDLTRKVNLDVASRYFSESELAWLDDRPDRFLRLWTVKEAYVKAIGRGLGAGLKAITVGFDPLRLEGVSGNWGLHQTQIGSHLLAIAVQRAASEFKIRRK